MEEVRREGVDDDDVVVVNAHVHMGANKSNTESSFIMMFTRRLQYSNNNNNNQGKEQAQQQESLKWRECAGKQALAKWRHQNRDSHF